ncbi:MAG: T9SS type A sorting domain-containing protein [Bacteroidota bacterium]
MKKNLLVSISLLVAIYCNGQGENNQWCFGNLAGLDFNSGAPVATSSQVNTTEGSSSIADASGNLLFYSDGVTVWNRNHVAMTNGTGLNGGASSTQSALIVGQPQTPGIYYIFTTAEAQGALGFCYSIVDMNLQGGFGDVTTRNVQLFTPCAEKVCATKHNNGIDIWVLGHELGTNNFVAYLLTSAGLSAPVISSCGTIYSFLSGVEIGYMKFSPDGHQLAHAMRYLFMFELDSFSTATGVVTAPVSFASTNGIQAYGVEFSPDGNILYTADDIQTSQYDITIHDSVSIITSKTYISNDIWALQLGPDSKIYLAGYFVSTLSVINDPNILGAGCNYVSGAIPLIGSSALGLPNQLSMLNSGPPVAIFSAPNHICPGTCTDFTSLSINASTFQWSFAGANPGVSTDANPMQICYNSPGQYSVSLIVTNAYGSDTLTLPNFITVYPYPAPQGIAQSGDSLFANQGAVNYQWYYDGNLIPGATDYFYVATQSGSFNVVATDQNGCEVEAVIFDVVAEIQPEEGSGSQELEIFPNPVLENITILKSGFSNGEKFNISIYNMIGEKVFIATGTSENTVDCELLSAGSYWIEVSNNSTSYRSRFVKQ